MPDSGPIQLLELVWQHKQTATSHSWLKINHAMREALSLSVRSGMAFHVDDLTAIRNRYRAGYWWSDLEWFYAKAVLYRNSSAWEAFETFRGRKAFIVKGASIRTFTGDGPAGTGLARLSLGAQFKWENERVTVTSFNDAAHSLTACSYAWSPHETCSDCKHIIGGGQQTLLHRYTITHADIREAKRKAKGAA